MRRENVRFAKNSIFGLVRTVITTGTSVFLMPYMIWGLGPEKYGLWVIILMFSTHGYLAIAELGLQGTMVRYLARYRADGDASAFKRLFVSGLMLFAAMGLFWCAALMLLGRTLMVDLFPTPPALADELRLAVSLYAVSYLVHFPIFVLRAFYMAVQDYRRLELSEVVRTLSFAAAIVVVLAYTDSLVDVVIVDFAVHAGVAVALAAMALRWHRAEFSLDPRWFSIASLRAIAGFAGYAFACRTFGVCYRMAPPLLVGLFLGPAQVTLFAVVQRIPNTLKLLLGPINAAAMPSAARLDAKETADQLRDFVFGGTRFGFLMITPLIAGLWVYADQILALWAGPGFAEAGDYMRAILAWTFLMGFISFGAATITRRDQYRNLLPFIVFANVVFVGVCMALIGSFGLWGVVTALLVSGVALVGGYMRILARSHRFGARDFFVHVVEAPVVRGGTLSFALFVLFREAFASMGSWGMLCGSAAVAFAYMGWAYWFALKGAERRAIHSFVAVELRRS